MAKTTDNNDDLLDMNEAIRLLKTTRPTFYRWLRSGRIKGTKIGRQWRFRREDLDRFLKGAGPRIDLPVDIGPLMNDLLAQLSEARGIRMVDDRRDAPAAVELLLWLAHARGASDLHLSAQQIEGESRPRGVARMRIDGFLSDAVRFDARLVPPLIEDLKTRAGCDPREKTRPQDGLIQQRYLGRKHSDGSVTPTADTDDVDVRTCFVPTRFGEAAACRLLRRSQVLLKLDDFGVPPDTLRTVREGLHGPSGLVVINGPTGSGKTTTLYACLLDYDASKRKLMSIEDPVEYPLPRVEQIQLDAAAGLTMTAALRAVDRSDPDVVMVGAPREREAIRRMGELAITGHTVLTTLHAPDAAEAVLRLTDLAGDPMLMADALRLVVSQLLVRRVDPDAAEPWSPDAESLDRAERLAREGGLDWGALPRRWVRVGASPERIMSGYRGRLPIHEVLVVDRGVASAIRAGADAHELRRQAIERGMRTLAADAVRLAAEGKTTLEEAFRVATPAHR